MINAIGVDSTSPHAVVPVEGNKFLSVTNKFAALNGGYVAAYEARRKGDMLEIWGSSAPANGTWAVGDINYFTAPVAAGKIGAVCVTAGTPGTWKGMA